MAKKTIFNFEALGKDYVKMLNEIRAGNSCSIFGIQNSMRPAICNSLSKKILFLTATPQTIFERVQSSTNRPLLNGNMNVEYITQLMEKRRSIYEVAADVIIKTDYKSEEVLLEEILAVL